MPEYTPAYTGDKPGRAQMQEILVKFRLGKYEEDGYNFCFHGYIPNKEIFVKWIDDLITAQGSLDRNPFYAGHHPSCIPSGKDFTSVNITFQGANTHNPVTHTCTIDNDLEGFEEVLAKVRTKHGAHHYNRLQ